MRLPLAVLLIPLAFIQAALGGGGAPGQVSPGPGVRRPQALVDDAAYADVHAARASWQAMWGTAQVSLGQVEGRRALTMPCNFRGTTIARASWDKAVLLDLTGCRGFRFQFLCRDSSPISGFSLYFQSGDGWYAAGFAPTQQEGWNSITINKEDTRIEGNPAGWGKIRAIRISAWRAQDVDTEFHLADMSLAGGAADGGEQPSIVVVRNESLAGSARGELDSVCQVTQQMASLVAELGLDYTVVSDLDLAAAGHLAGKRLLVLPHSPALSDTAVDAIAKFLEQDGRLLAFFQLPPRLASAAGLTGGQYIAQQHPGQFAAIHFADSGLDGAPPVVGQRSWNIVDYRPAAGRGRVAAWWHDQDGRNSGHPAIVASDRCIYMSHVLLPDDPANKRRMLLAMMGHLLPELWAQAAQHTVQQVGQLGPFASFDQAHAAIAQAPETAQSLSAAAARRDGALALIAQGKYPDAMAAAEQAQRQMIEAYCRTQSPQPAEHRAFWCHDAFGVAGMGWDESIKLLADNGFTAIVPNMLWGGVAFYDSQVLPVAPQARQKGDQIAQCLAACRKYGVQIHVWKVNWNMGWNAPGPFTQRMKQAGRTQVAFDGKANDQWLCPSHPDNQKLEIDAMVEVATKYDVDGIHFDYIRYPDADGCFCQGCRQRFEQVIGKHVGNWPADVRSDPGLLRRWLDFRRANITRVVAAVGDQVHKTRPKVKVSAAVFPNWSVDRDSVGQDWKLWCEKGYLDFVCPMDYTASTAEFEQQVRRQIQWAGKVPCYPGMGLSVWPGSSRDICKLIDQITVARRLGAKGFTIFQYDLPVAQQVVPLCGLGITRPR